MPTDYTGDPTQARGSSDAPISFLDLVTALPAGGDPRNAASVEQAFKTLNDWVTMLKNIQKQIFGDGAAGDLVVGGTTGPTGLQGAPRYDDLTVSVGGEFTVFGSTIYVAGKLTWAGKLSSNGANGGNGGVGTNGSAGDSNYRHHSPGGRGMVNANGEAAPALATPYTAATSGGDGGNGGATNGGSSATAYPDPASFRIGPHVFAFDPSSGLIVPYRGGRGGGGGGGDAANGGGGGGEGGGLIVVCAREVEIAVTASWDALGGNGGNATAGNCGGGGGGQGGGMLLICGLLTGTPPTGTVTGGTAGTKTGTGVNGTAGAAGASSIVVVELGQ